MRLARLAYCLVAALAGLPLCGCQENRLTASSSSDAPSRPARAADNSASQGPAAQSPAGRSSKGQPPKGPSSQGPSSKAQASTGTTASGKRSPGGANAATPRPAAGEPPAPTARRDAAPGRTLDMNFDAIQFEMQKGGAFQRSMLTERIESLAGKKIRIRGYVHPAVFTQTGITNFVLVRDNMECCFGPGAMLYDCIMVAMKPGKSIDFTTRPIAVEGVFSIEEVVYDGQHLAIYRIDADSAG